MLEGRVTAVSDRATPDALAKLCEDFGWTDHAFQTRIDAAFGMYVLAKL